MNLCLINNNLMLIVLVLLFSQIIPYGLSFVEDNQDRLKQEMAITQFKNKLIEQLKAHNIESVLVGASYQSGGRLQRKKPVNDVLDKIEEIKVLPQQDPQIVKKTLIPGVNVRKCGKVGMTCVEFHFSKELLKEEIDSAKFILAIDNPEEGFIRWKFSFENEHFNHIVFYQQSQSMFGGIHEIEGLDILRQILSKSMGVNSENIVKLRISGRKSKRRKIFLKTIILVVGLKPSLKRYRRKAKVEADNRCNHTTIFCCLKNFTVTPYDIGLQNLISPDSIELSYCRGDCNHFASHKSNHALYLSILKRSKNGRLSPRQLDYMRTCCTPTKYNDLEIQYREYSQAINKVELNNMIATRCGCN